MAYYGDTHDEQGWGSTVTVARGTYTATRRLPYLIDDGIDGEWIDDGYADVTYVRSGLERVSPRELPPPVRFRSPVREFVHKYGWRAYALPVLMLVTVVALATARTPTARSAPTAGPSVAATSTAAPPPVTSSTPIASASAHTAAPPASAALKPAALPPGAPYTLAGKGTFRVLKGSTRPVGSGDFHRYDIEVENGVTGVDLTAFARLVDTTLDDPRSWTGHGARLQRVADPAQADFHISLTSAMTVRSLCGYDIPAETSCYITQGQNGSPVNRVVMNVARWTRGATAYLGHLDTYRIYMINHEDGHAIGHMHAHSCLANGMAPVMMQQTFGMVSVSDHRTCAANPWPFPAGAGDAPGAEGSDSDANNEYYLAN